MISLKVKLDISKMYLTSKTKYSRNCECGIFEWTTLLRSKPSYLFPLRKYSYHSYRCEKECIINFKEDIYNWLIEIGMEVSLHYYNQIFSINFDNEKDAVMFKMAWL